MTNYPLPGLCLDQHMAPKASDDQTGLGASGWGMGAWVCLQDISASTFDAQRKSLTEMPSTSWVLKRTVQLP